MPINIIFNSFYLIDNVVYAYLAHTTWLQILIVIVIICSIFGFITLCWYCRKRALKTNSRDTVFTPLTTNDIAPDQFGVYGGVQWDKRQN